MTKREMELKNELLKQTIKTKELEIENMKLKQDNQKTPLSSYSGSCVNDDYWGGPKDSGSWLPR